MDDEGNWKTIASDLSYKAADDVVDRFTDDFPNAFIDVVEHKSQL